MIGPLISRLTSAVVHCDCRLALESVGIGDDLLVFVLIYPVDALHASGQRDP